MARPALSNEAGSFLLGYLPAGELAERCDAMFRFGIDRPVLLKIARAHAMGA